MPGREGQLPKEAGEFYFLVSDAVPPALTVPGPPTFLPYSPAPLGNDFSVQFGDDFALPLLGNFDPPVGGESEALAPETLTNQLDRFDTNMDGKVTALDALVVINALGRTDHIQLASPGRLVAAFGGFTLGRQCRWQHHLNRCAANYQRVVAARRLVSRR